MNIFKQKWKIIGISIISLGLVCGCGSRGNVNIQEGFAAMETQSYDKALGCFEKAIVQGEDFEQAYRGEGIAYLGMAQYDQAIEAFKKALGQAGMFPSATEYDINFYLATAQYKNGDAAGAIATLDAIIKLKDTNTDAYFLRGSAWMKVLEHDKGIADLEKAMQLAEYDPELVIDVYEVLDTYGYAQEGKTYLNNLLTDHVSNMTEYEKGKVYFYLQDYENARNSLETAKAETKKPDAVIVLLLGRTYEELGDKEYASVIYHTFLDENEPNAEIYNQLGLCRLSVEDYEGAKEAFAKGLKVEGNAITQNLSYNQIVAYEYLGEFEQAKKLMAKYIKNYPDDKEAQREYTFLKSR